MLKPTSTFLRQLGFTHPGVLIDEEQACTNIRTMMEKSRANGTLFRPHFKTHQSAEVGQWFADEGVAAITVSSVKMAEYFADHGWSDITIAFLFNPLEWPKIEILARKLQQLGGALGLTIDSPEAAAWLAKQSPVPLHVWIKFDAGYGRTGVEWQNHGALQSIIKQLDGKFKIQGLLTHSGNSYHAESRQELDTIWKQTLSRMEKAQSSLDLKLTLSVGDTPCCHTREDFSGVQEIRPGNFVFFDLMQWNAGVCETKELAAAAVCPIVGIYPQRNQIVLHGGAVQLSKESLSSPCGQPIFGYLGTFTSGENETSAKQVLTDAPIISLSQEHGIVQFPANSQNQYLADLEIGDLALVWPVHSCLTCNLASQFRTTNGTVLNKDR